MNKALITFLKNNLRKISAKWGPIWKTKLKARRPHKGPNKRLKYEYQCFKCKKYYPNKNVQVDHIIPVGKFSEAKDMVGYVERLFCCEDDLQVLCTKCHQCKTNADRT